MTSKAIWRDRAKAWQAMCESWIIFENNARNKYLQSRRWSAAWKRAAKLFRKERNDYRNFVGMENVELISDMLVWQQSETKIVRGKLTEARSIARRLLRERDEETLLLTDCQDRVDRYFAKITSLKSQVSHLESDRDALAMQCDELQEDYVLLQNLAGATTQAMQEVGAEADKLRGALEQVEFVSFADKTWCPWCLNLNHKHNHDCPRQKALGKA